MRILLIPAQLRSFKRVKDGSVDYSFRSTVEVDNKDFALTDEYYQQTGYLAFKLNEIEVGDIPAEKAQVKGQISESQYLRNCLFAKHMALGGTKETFPKYYHDAMQGFAKAVNNSYES
jgi:hypothetical protein